MNAELRPEQLSEYLSFKNGKSSPDRYDGAPIPVYGSNGLIGFSDKSNSVSNTIIIGRVGSYCGSVHYSEEPCWVSDNAIICSSKNPADSLFWFYFLTFADLNQYRSGSGQPLLNQNTLNSIECHVPDELDVRVRIGKFLALFDRKIQLNHQINQILEQMAQAIFKSWFVDFEPVKAKIATLEAGGSAEDALLAAMQAISGKNDAQLNQLQTEQPEQYAELRATAELFPSAMQESELGEIPEGWEVDELASKIDVLNGFAFKSEDYVAKPGLFVLRTKNFNSCGVAERLSDDVFLPEGFEKSHEKYLCEAYDHHLVMVGASVGKTAIIFPSELPALRNQNMWCFRPKKASKVGKSFTKYILNGLIETKRGLASGSAREFFRKGDFQQQKICFATEKILEKFDTIVFPYIASQASNIAENITLSSLRDSLLPKLLSGELRLPEAEEQIQEAADAV
nr:restriction endonuclease subunit S [uncultured Tolumonas sp.]